MLKHTSLIVAGALVLGMGISTVSFAEMPSLDSQSYTRPGILDWEGMGADVSKHPDKPGHDPMNCGICR